MGMPVGLPRGASVVRISSIYWVYEVRRTEPTCPVDFGSSPVPRLRAPPCREILSRLRQRQAPRQEPLTSTKLMNLTDTICSFH
jgi:hypothetical protein